MEYFNTYSKLSIYSKLYNRRYTENEFLQFEKRYTVNGYLLIWHLDGRFHHSKKPAITEFVDEIITSKSYYINGKRHNTMGPAVIYYGRNGYMDEHFYYLDGVCKNMYSVDSGVYIY